MRATLDTRPGNVHTDPSRSDAAQSDSGLMLAMPRVKP
jgi:hypothetical protein